MFTIGDLVKQFKISRSTILYYDKIGLLKPSERTDSNYRLYSNGDVERLKTIMRHREAGIPLKDIMKLLEIENTNISDILTRRLKNIQTEIITLKKQEQMILAVLIKEVRLSDSILFDRKSWSKLLVSIGFSIEDLENWHSNFEKDSPDDHTEFLKALGMQQDDIEKFRSHLKVK